MRAASLPASQRALHVAVRDGLHALDTQLRTSSALLPVERWTVRRPDGGWSVSEILEHCCLANEAYLGAMRAALARAGAPRVTAHDFPWKPTLMGGLLRWSLEATFKLPAPGTIKPGPAARPHVLDALIATHDTMRTMMDASATRDWRRLRFVSPLSQLVRPNFGDAFAITLRHGQRHCLQLERTIALVG